MIITFVFATYFTQVVANNKVDGMSSWAWMMSLSAAGVAFLAPIVGSVLNNKGTKKRWLIWLTILSSLACIALWNVKGTENYILLALVLVGAANVFFEISMIFYNAMLGDLSPPSHVGRWSGWGWATGYFGGLICLGLTLLFFVQPETPFLSLNKEEYEHLRISGPFVGLWFLIFSLPLLFCYKETTLPNTKHHSYINSLNSLSSTFKRIRSYPTITRFLIARMIYVDGLNTLFAMGGVYAAGTFGFNFNEIIMFGIVINISAGLGAAIFAWADDILGSKRVIMASLCALIILYITLLIIEDKTSFWILATTLGIFVGPVQSASRALLTRITPRPLLTEMFGLYALSGKATAFLGPAILALMASIYDSQKVGMASILIFFFIGLFVIKKVDATKS